MAWLKEHIGTLTYPRDRATTFVAVTRKLERLHLPMEKNERDGTIVVRCLSRPVSLLLWRCWSDKLFIQLTERVDRKTDIRLDAIPNLFRISGGKDEREIKRDALIAELSQAD